ncbi:hypothetical protein X777_01866 [Ooceraea biroi]|uniref:Uncharacterized protein n=1 Tax=Ooceraea biroi TaxID=2015173 RepID=A0A026WQD5_OOCBI|nr:hypothetical protein X777_01866 [Ooceraea biroi]
MYALEKTLNIESVNTRAWRKKDSSSRVCNAYQWYSFYAIENAVYAERMNASSDKEFSNVIHTVKGCCTLRVLQV